jgi:hypothetical protein
MCTTKELIGKFVKTLTPNDIILRDTALATLWTNLDTNKNQIVELRELVSALLLLC